MNALINDLRLVFREQRTMVLLGAALTLLLAVYFIGWHYTIITFGSFYSVLDVRGPFLARTAYYLAESFIFAGVICAVMISAERPVVKKIFIGLVMAVFTASGIIRMFDWGALFFSGMHINNNFWAHAFYTDGLVFLVAKESFALYAAFILFFVGMVRILKKMYAYSCREK